MTADIQGCDHAWDGAEMCETPFGHVSSPTCRYCGAVKLVEERRAYQTQQAPPAPRQTAVPAAPAAIATNIPPAGATVHAFQSEFFRDV